MVTDNQGNTYALAIQRQRSSNLEFGTAIYYCEQVVASSGTFTITITGTTAAAPYRFTASAVVYGGDGLVGKKLSLVTTSGGDAGAAATILTLPNRPP